MEGDATKYGSLPFVDPELFSAHSQTIKSFTKDHEGKKGDNSGKSSTSRKRKLESQESGDSPEKKASDSEGFKCLDHDRVRSSVYKPSNSDSWIKSRWISCVECKRWRRVACCLPFESMAKWNCSENSNDKFSSCEAGEEILRDGEVLLEGEEHDKSYEQEKEEFSNHLSSFLSKHNLPSLKKPLLGGKDLDLYRLYREVIYRGGYKAVVSKPGTWSKIFRTLENSKNRKVTDASYRLKWYYIESLYAYEQQHFHGLDPTKIEIPKKRKRASRAGKRSAGKALDAFAANFWRQTQMMATRNRYWSAVPGAAGAR